MVSPRVATRTHDRCDRCDAVLAVGARAARDPERHPVCRACRYAVSRVFGGELRQYEQRRAMAKRYSQHADVQAAMLRLTLASGRTVTVQPRSAVELFDVRVPYSRTRIGHVVVSTSGVYVIVAETRAGRVRVRPVRFWRRHERLRVGRRNCTRALKKLRKQMELARSVIDGRIPVHGVVGLPEASWPNESGRLRAGNTWVLSTEACRQVTLRQGPLAPAQVEAVAQRLASLH